MSEELKLKIFEPLDEYFGVICAVCTDDKLIKYDGNGNNTNKLKQIIEKLQTKSCSKNECDEPQAKTTHSVEFDRAVESFILNLVEADKSIGNYTVKNKFSQTFKKLFDNSVYFESSFKIDDFVSTNATFLTEITQIFGSMLEEHNNNNNILDQTKLRKCISLYKNNITDKDKVVDFLFNFWLEQHYVIYDKEKEYFKNEIYNKIHNFVNAGGNKDESYNYRILKLFFQIKTQCGTVINWDVVDWKQKYDAKLYEYRLNIKLANFGSNEPTKMALISNLIANDFDKKKDFNNMLIDVDVDRQYKFDNKYYIYIKCSPELLQVDDTNSDDEQSPQNNTNTTNTTNAKNTTNTKNTNNNNNSTPSVLEQFQIAKTINPTLPKTTNISEFAQVLSILEKYLGRTPSTQSTQSTQFTQAGGYNTQIDYPITEKYTKMFNEIKTYIKERNGGFEPAYEDEINKLLKDLIDKEKELNTKLSTLVDYYTVLRKMPDSIQREQIKKIDDDIYMRKQIKKLEKCQIKMEQAEQTTIESYENLLRRFANLFY